MADADPTYAKGHDATAWDAGDGPAQLDALTTLTNGITNSTAIEQGTVSNNIVRLEFDQPILGLQVGDTVSIHNDGVDTYVNMALVPYSSATGVDTSNKIVQAVVIQGVNVFSLTTGFINTLFDLGAGKWGCRVVEDLEIAGFVKLTEVEADLSLFTVFLGSASLSGVGTLSASGGLITDPPFDQIADLVLKQLSEFRKLILTFAGGGQLDVSLAFDRATNQATLNINAIDPSGATIQTLEAIQVTYLDPPGSRTLHADWLVFDAYFDDTHKLTAAGRSFLRARTIPSPNVGTYESFFNI